MTQYISIILILTAIAGSVFYFRSIGAIQINSGQETKLTGGLVGYWTFDGNHMDWSNSTAEVRDQAGTNHGNAISLTSSDAAPGKIGQALSFDDGNSDYVDTGFVPVAGTSARTLAYWVKHTSSGWQTFMKWGSSRPGEAFRTGLDGSNRMAIDVHNDYGYCGDSVSNNEWNFFALVMEEGTTDLLSLKPYVNGELKIITRAGIQETINTTSDDNFTIGRNSSFNGQIDEVRIYNRALSVTEITELYQQGQVKINASQETKLTDGLVLYQSFDGNHMDWSAEQEALDQSPSGVDGDVNLASSNPSAVIGKIGQALNFDGTNDFIYDDIGGSGVLNGIDNATFSVWVKRAGSGSTAYETIVQEGASGSGYALAVDCNNDNNLQFGVRTGGTSYMATTSNSIIVDNKWHYVTGVYDGDSNLVYIYVDGVEKDNSPADVDVPDPGVGISIGSNNINNPGNVCDGSSTEAPFNGSIDEVRVYDRVLTQDEIQELYNLGQAKINASQDTKLTDGLVGNWTFDGNHMDWNLSGGEVLDQAGSNDGDATNMDNSNAVIGKVGQGLEFDGSTNYIDAGNPSLISMDHTMCLWFYANSFSSNPMVLNYANSADSINTGIIVWNGGILQIADGNTGGRIANATLLENNWYHVCATMANIASSTVDFEIYVNGQLDNSGNGNYNPWAQNGLRIGSRIDNDVYFNGIIDEVRIYNRALTASEVSQLYMMGK